MKRFENSQDYIGQITTKNYSDFPDFFINKFFGRHESGIIFFLFEYWLQQDNEIKAKEFAELGFDLLKSNQEDLYFKEFKNYLDNGN